MASTNKTPNYGLPQYTADDKPTYLGDFNKAMLDIDTVMKNNADMSQASETLANNANDTASSAVATALDAQNKALTAQTKADSASTIANNAQTDAQQAMTDASDAKTLANSANTNASSASNSANEAISTAQSAQSTASSAQSNAQQAINSVNELTNLLNISVFEKSTDSDITVTNGSLFSHNFTVAKNNEGSIAKFYGNIMVNNIPNEQNATINIQTSLRPSSDIIINNSAYQHYIGITTLSNSNNTFKDCTLKTNGQIQCTVTSVEGVARVQMFFLPYLYFIKDFGDTPNTDA